MALTYQEREWRRQWVINNPDKAREANKRWRAANVNKVRAQARERMKRWRKRRAVAARSS